MSKERARRRAEREAEAARLAEKRAAQAARAGKAREVRQKVRGFFPDVAPGPAAKRGRKRAAIVAALFVFVQGVAWLVGLTWTGRFAVLVVSLLIFPVAAAVAFDKR